MLVREKVRHLISCGIEGDFTEIEKMYQGEPFDVKDPTYRELLNCSKRLCQEYTALCADKTADKKRDEILDKLFPYHGRLYGVGAGINVVIGMVELGNNCYINANVSFMSDVLVSTGDYFICAPNVTFGQENSKGNVSKIVIGNDTWFCADVVTEGNVTVEAGSIVGLGSRVVSGTVVKEKTIFSGNPAKFIKPAVKRHSNGKFYPLDVNDKARCNYVIAHLKSLKVGDDFTEVLKLLCGKNYNSLDAVVSEVNRCTHSICEERNRVSEEEKEALDNKLFPIKGKNCKIGNNIFVDSIGSVSIGDNVTIGNNVCLMGKIEIGNNCKIGDNVTLVAIGHGIWFEDRHITNSGELLNTGGFVKILDGVSIGNNVKIGQRALVDRNIKENTVKTASEEFKIQDYIMV